MLVMFWRFVCFLLASAQIHDYFDAASRPGVVRAETFSTTMCCQENGSSDDASAAISMVMCANTSTPPRKGARHHDRGRTPRFTVLVMQLATPNLWNSFCKYSTLINAAWARGLGHFYTVTAGDFLMRADIWRGGNIRAVLEIMQVAPSHVDWIFHLDCDAVFTDFSGNDTLKHAVAEFAGSRTQVLLSRDETGYAGSSRLANLGTGLWRKSKWTKKFLRLWWRELEENSSLTEQEVLERLLHRNALGMLDRVEFLPAGRLNSEMSNPISAPPRAQPVIHLAGLPNEVRMATFRLVWSMRCAATDGKVMPDPDGWTLRESFMRALQTHVELLPAQSDVPATSLLEASGPMRVTRRLALALLAGRDQDRAGTFIKSAMGRCKALEEHGAVLGAGAVDHIAAFAESLAGPLLELGHVDEARALLQSPRPAGSTPRSGHEAYVHSQHLAAVLEAGGRFAEAEPHARSALHGFEAAFPARTRDVRPHAARARLARITLARGLGVEAEALLRGALRGYESSLGLEHPETLGCVRNLAVLLKQLSQLSQVSAPMQGRAAGLQEAGLLLHRAVAGYSNALGDAHPDTERARRNLANFQRWHASQKASLAPSRADL